ncbi:Spy/CpxP family protein refolding chaperone [Undibacterium oligocarboniphilum]|uniref:Spy/CpxP family protein refolding chaperone n=1 Tax=Undibacterium oligocarboniphilum TaxID=666702 RepID=A0A850QFF7_9BURK|nr:Spy/CpxP family protein refolding chaperone [Undibacterium oligocarboniphilum]MBC3869298.1 Spy/CpxP family protein refolding chaperone [Undibacterium oligocarboniphilum]NVO77677.1 Spy/CpxP family protein refolding chaperone [Undibacterium oligocarboniphilum]
MNHFKQRLLVIVIAAGCSISAGAMAQSVSDPRPSRPPVGEPGKTPEQMREMMKDHLAKHQAELHDTLKITAAQEPAWKTFVQSMTPKTMPVPEDPKAMEKMTTPQRMEKSLERMKERQMQMQDRLAAVKAFYAVLTPEQQKAFDEAHRRMRKDAQQNMANQMQKKDQMPGMMDRPPMDKPDTPHH